MAGTSWSDSENDLIVADYFTMLFAELSGEKYVKANHRRNLVSKLNDRSEGSVEFKHQNISAVMLGLGQPWITGYKPASQFQASLVDAVIRALEKCNFSELKTIENRKVKDPRNLWVGPPPTHSNQPPPVDAERMAIIARKYDVAARDARNRRLGLDGEEFTLDYEKHRLRSEGRSDLSDQVIWTSKEEGDGAGYDIHSFEGDGSPKLIEVKTTNGWERTPFHISRNELRVANEFRDSWCLLRLWNFAREPRAFELRPPLDRHVDLTPTSFLASLN